MMRLPSTPLVNAYRVYGRDEDKEAIIAMLMGNAVCHEDVSVIPIVGMGGIGKTTLAQLVYNDRVVRQNFHLKAWVCVTEEFDVFAITKTIFKAVTDLNGEWKDLNMLQVSLLEKFSKSKFLMVLDDVWNESDEKWDLLLKPFQFGPPGSRIIVTTRSEAVASLVGYPREAYHMKLLTDEDCLALLAQDSRQSLDENLELGEIGLGLARWCKGLPLAAKILGGLLRCKETTEWEFILKSKTLDLPEENMFLRILRLSYDYLPSHLKHLFAYCSIFPKGYKFDKKELILLWMGEGFLEMANKMERKEELGLYSFNELLSKSFFQRLSGSKSIFLMHDSLHDLASFAAGTTCHILEDKIHSNRLPRNVRHASFLRHENKVFKKIEAFSELQGLRTFLPMPVQSIRDGPPSYSSNKILVELLPKLPRLRVLSLSGYYITELPNTVCNLIHLRYLNLSGTPIVTLPDSLGDLYRLETLSLCNCRFLRNLPPTMGNLVNLRHLDISGTDKLKAMPIGIGKLRNLQTLPKMVVSKSGGLGLKELRNLKLLRGKLAILELQNVKDNEDAQKASLGCKNELDELQLAWGSGVDESLDRNSDEELLDLLEPHENLRELKIDFYGGPNFPRWIGDPLFRKLLTVTLRGCNGCTSLPSLGQLTELKELRIREMPKINCIGSEFYGNGVTVPFPKLEILVFNYMPGWEKWSSFGNGEFPQLRQLVILKCRKLTNVSPLCFPALNLLDLEGCSTMILENLSNLNALRYLKVESITGISHMPIGLMQSLSALEVLEFCSCNELLSLWPNEVISLEHFTCLRRLIVEDCADFMSLPNDLSDLKSLEDLIIKKCPKFIDFPENGVPPMLKRLEILTCNALESLPSNILNLERLEVTGCSSLKTWGTSHFPIDLKKLSINSCTQLEPVSDMMFPEEVRVSLKELSLCNWLKFDDLLQRLNGFSNLVKLSLITCSDLRHFPERGLPPHLRELCIEDCVTLKSFPSKMSIMASLESLEIRSCPRLQNFPKFDFPPNLSSLTIWDCKGFKPLKEWGLDRLSSLKEFSICGGFREIKVLGDDCLFPSSLIKLSISKFPELQSLSKVLENLTLLRHLSVTNCAKLNDLPSDKLLENLWDLKISECAVLSPKCVKDRGHYWSKISSIPCVEIDGAHVYS